jgi:hypothetical protein
LSRASRLRGAELAALLAVFTALAVGFERAVPLLEAPDEPSHLQYAAFLAWEGRLPGARDGQPDVPGEGMQPPAYYAWLAPFVRLRSAPDLPLVDELRRINLVGYLMSDEKALSGVTRIRVIAQPRYQFYEVTPEVERLRALRYGTLPFGLLAVALVYAAMLSASGSRPLALLAASLFGLVPQIVFVSSYVNNDAAAAALGAGALWFTVRCALRGPTRRDYLAGALLFALGAATKLSTLPALAVTCAAVPLLDARSLRERARDAGLAAALGAALLALLAASNLSRFGEPTGTAAVWASAAELTEPSDFGGVVAYFTGYYAIWTFQSYWARFGWMNVSAPFSVYLGFFTLLWTGLLGFALGAWRRPAPSDAPTPLPAPLLRRYLVAVVLATWGTHLWLNTQTAAGQGRHLFGAAPHLACMLAMGVAWLTSGDPLRIGWAPALALAGALAGITLYCLLGVVMPAYST